MPKEQQEKPKLEWIEESKKDQQDLSNRNPIYYRDDMDFLRENRMPDSSGSVLIRFLKENAFVSIGCLCTTGFLFNGLRNFFNNNASRSQLMMRGRVVAQGLTVVALLAGALQEANKRMAHLNEAPPPPTSPGSSPTPSPTSS